MISMLCATNLQCQLTRERSASAMLNTLHAVSEVEGTNVLPHHVSLWKYLPPPFINFLLFIKRVSQIHHPTVLFVFFFLNLILRRKNSDKFKRKMGASSSTDQKTSQEQHELESLAISTGSLPLLQKAFSKLSDPNTNSIPLQSLQECFRLIFATSSSTDENTQIPECFPRLLSCLGSAIIDLFFIVDKDGINWIEFLRGYTKSCGRMSSSMALVSLYRIYAATTAKAEFPSKLEFESDDLDTKISGYVMPTDVLMLLWMCWIMSQNSKTSKQEDLPDIDHLILSAITSSTEMSSDINLWECSISDLEVQLPAQKFHMWALSTVPNLAHCFTQYINNSLQRCLTSEEKPETSSSSSGDITSTDSHKTYILTSGRAWSISLTLTSTLSEAVLRANTPRADGKESENLLYRSSLHGKGMNRFWSSVEGYHGPLLVLISASSSESGEADPNIGRWIIGVLTQQGFENKDVFYGSSGNLYAISPIFHVFSPHGGDKNFVYSHLHATGKAYEPHPKPVGLAFGGTAGNERIFIDEDFTRITFRHHAVDKTYRPGSLFPNQGYLLVEASVFQVEIWGLGGQKVKEMQNSHMQREQLFTEQRRKVDLNSFGKWEDSPEKMMMSMVADPNRPQREER